MDRTKFAWADATQAQERLQGTYVMYKGECYYIEEVRSTGARVMKTSDGSASTIKLSDEGWNDFRILPPTGWVNLIGGSNPRALFLKRVPVRGRRHGLSTDTVVIREVAQGVVTRCRDNNLATLLGNRGYLDTISNNYPTAEEAIEKTPHNTAVAFSRKYAIYRDLSGLAWLYRNDYQVGFVSKATILVFPDTSYIADEIREISPETTIKELS